MLFIWHILNSNKKLFSIKSSLHCYYKVVIIVANKNREVFIKDITL